MGMNYYFNVKDQESIHIGKSSTGWAFQLHAYPKKRIYDLKDWLRYIDEQGQISECHICDENDEVVLKDDLIKIIAHRQPFGQYSKLLHKEYRTRGAWFYDCDTGLLRARLNEDICISHGHPGMMGTGSWDCIIGDFS